MCLSYRMHPCLISRFALALHHVSSITREQNHTSRKIFMLNMICQLYKGDKINVALSCLLSHVLVNLKSQSLNLPMLSKSLRASIKYECLRGEVVSRKWSNLSVYGFGSSEIGSQLEVLVLLKNPVPPVEPLLDHRSIRCRPVTPTPYRRSNR